MYNPNVLNYGGSYGAAAPYGGNPYSGATYGGSSHHQQPDDKLSKVKDPLLNAVRWVKQRSPKEKLALGCTAGVVVVTAFQCPRVGSTLKKLHRSSYTNHSEALPHMQYQLTLNPRIFLM